MAEHFNRSLDFWAVSNWPKLTLKGLLEKLDISIEDFLKAFTPNERDAPATPSSHPTPPVP